MALSHVELLKTVNFAVIKHANQRRKDANATPYINHPVGVAQLIADLGKVDDLVVLQAALLHDTVEDTKTTFEELEQTFGKKVTDVVREVTDDKKLSKVDRKKLQIVHAAHASREAKLVKLADKLYNMRDLISSQPTSWSVDYIQGYFVWGKAVIDGVRGTNAPLESALDELFKGSFTHTLSGKTYTCLPSGDLVKALEHYYTLC